MLRQRLSQKMTQKLSPQQIQLMKLLQVPTASLDERIQEEMEANPALEEGNEAERDENIDKQEEEPKEESTGDELDLSDYFTDDDQYSSYKTKGDSYSQDDDKNETIPVAVQETFHESLVKQIGVLTLDDRRKTIAKQLIGSIDDDGYIRREMEAIVDDLAFSQNITAEVEELDEILDIIQDLEPAGVGARDLRECLLLQINKKAASPETVMASKILEKYFEEFSKKHYEKLQKQLKATAEEFKAGVDEILKLNPKPGGVSSSSSKIHQYIIPDFTILNNNGELELLLNSRNAPELRVSDNFRDMYKSYKAGPKKDKQQKEAILFIKQKIDSAKWFIDAIRQRQQTLFNSMYSIMERQYEFFLSGDETKLQPMILKDIAEKTNLDISTISRVANSKYVNTEFGTFSLKYFFSESLTTDSGEEVSTREVKRILADFIEAEEKRKPLSDQKLTELLKEKGYNIARRTVAKYREQLNIPVARLRKEL
ncbi:MAG: RNA polymerase sigma-54 factor [Limisphaerales bacterium]|jgi:RNA polymerase sigma-54 factor